MQAMVSVNDYVVYAQEGRIRQRPFLYMEKEASYPPVKQYKKHVIMTSQCGADTVLSSMDII